MLWGLHKRLPGLALTLGLVAFAAVMARGREESTLLTRARLVKLPYKLAWDTAYAWRSDSELLVMERRAQPRRARVLDLKSQTEHELPRLNAALRITPVGRIWLDRDCGEWVIGHLVTSGQNPIRLILDLQGNEVAQIPPSPAPYSQLVYLPRFRRAATFFPNVADRAEVFDTVSGRVTHYSYRELDKEDVAGFLDPETFLTTRSEPKDHSITRISAHSFAHASRLWARTVRLPAHDALSRAILSPDGKRVLWLTVCAPGYRWWWFARFPIFRAALRRNETWMLYVSDIEGNGIRELGRFLRNRDNDVYLRQLGWKPDSRTISFAVADRLYELDTAGSPASGP
jgi:hypothetical protein